MPPLEAVRTAWVAGRLALGFDDQQLAFIRDLDVDDRPYIWDLPEE